MRRAAAAALLVVLAGCSSGGVGTESPTLTPVPVEGEGTPVGGATEAAVGGIAPGLTEDGVTDPFALADAHRAALADRSYTVIHRRSVRDGNGTIRTVRRTVNVGADRATYRLVQTTRSDASYPVQPAAAHVAIWVDHEGALYRIGRDDPRYRFDADGRAADPVTDITYHDRLAGLYGGLDWQLTAEDVDSVGKAYYVVRATRATDPSVLTVPPLVREPRNVRARAVLTGEGRLRQYRITYEATVGDEPVQVVLSLQFERIDVTTVERPAWYEDAVNATAVTPSASPRP